MCIFSVVYQHLADCPVFVLTNRDESTERPSLPPQEFISPIGGTRWFGGADAKAGGTWFGINEYGLIAAITNRKKNVEPSEPRSRGLLCRDVLGHSTAGAAVDWVQRELVAREYAGFNLILLSVEGAWVIEALDEPLCGQLEPGIHTVGNGPLAAVSDPRVAFMQSLVERMVADSTDGKARVRRAEEICRIQADEGSPGICLHGDRWGTVGSTIAAVGRVPQQAEYHYAAGPPCTTPYVDYSAQVRRMLSRDC